MSDHARRIVGIEKVNKGAERWTGKDELVAVVDSGIDSSHPDLAESVASFAAVKGAMDTDRAGHGTHVSGTIAGRGTASKGKIRGMAPEARLVGLGIVAESGDLCLPTDLGELLRQVADKGAKIINLSWGTPVSAAYENGSMAVDTFAREHPDVLVVVAAGNKGRALRGYPALYSVGSPATAKNVLTVGACASDRRSFDTTWGSYGEARFPSAPTSEQHLAGDPTLPAALSSRGPTDTESVKPDVLAPGTAILAPRAAQAPAGAFWNQLKYGGHYGYMNGTSMATPVVSGAAAVLRHYLREGRKLESPSSALLRAALIASAIRIPWAREPTSEAECGYPDFDQGFGRIDLGSLIPHAASPKGHALGLADVRADDDDALEARAPEGAQHRAIHSYAFKVPSKATEPLRIVMAWTDYSARSVQNLLKLDVRGPAGKRWRGNEEHCWLLPPEADLDPETLDMRCDQRNNVQSVLVEKPPPGEYHVRATAQNTLFPPQGFAICVCGQLEGDLQRGADPDAVRVWRGFRAPAIDLPAFHERLGTVFIPSTVLMQIDAGLDAYIPTVLGGLADKPATVPDETAILFWDSRDAYREGFKTLAVRTYTLTHGAVYTAASGAEFPQPFSGTLAPGQPYNLVERVADWMHGTVRHLVGARPPEVLPADFRAGLADALGGVASPPPGAIVCAGDDYVTYWQLEADTPPDPDPLAELAALTAWNHTSAAQPTSLEAGLWEQWPGITIVPGQSLNLQFRRRWEDR